METSYLIKEQQLLEIIALAKDLQKFDKLRDAEEDLDCKLIFRDAFNETNRKLSNLLDSLPSDKPQTFRVVESSTGMTLFPMWNFPQFKVY